MGFPEISDGVLTIRTGGTPLDIFTLHFPHKYYVS